MKINQLLEDEIEKTLPLKYYRRHELINIFGVSLPTWRKWVKEYNLKSVGDNMYTAASVKSMVRTSHKEHLKTDNHYLPACYFMRYYSKVGVE